MVARVEHTAPEAPGAPETADATPEALARLGDAIAGALSAIAAATSQVLERLARFDRAGGWHAQGALSCAHWLAWRCGMSLVTAREKVRAARALEALPLISAAFARGELSYCKVRSLTRVAARDTEATLLSYARYSSGATLARLCRGYAQALAAERPPDAPRERWLRWLTTDDGMVRLDARLRPEEAAVVRKALEAAKVLAGPDRWTPADAAPPAAPAPEDEAEVAGAPGAPNAPAAAPHAHAPAGAPDAPAHAHAHAHAPAGAPPTASVPAPGPPVGGAAAEDPAVPADPPAPTDAAHPTTPGTVGVAEAERQAGVRWADGWADALVSVAEAFLADRAADRADPVPGRFEVALHVDLADLRARGGVALAGCELEGGAWVPRETARRLACDAPHLRVEHGVDGEVEGVGRRTRRISTAQRRALAFRDGGCRFPSCENRLFVDGHHVTHWVDGGATSLDNLVLLCRRHHRLVHEGGFRMQLDPRGPTFFDPRGRRIDDAPSPPPPPPDDPLAWLLARDPAASGADASGADASGAGGPDRATALRTWGDSRGDRQLAVQLLLERRRRAG